MFTGEPSIWETQEFGPAAVDLSGRTALVTGAAQGLGQAIAVGLARFGASVAICDRNGDGLLDTAGLIGDRLVAQGTFNCRDRDRCLEFAAAVTEKAGRLDILVNNAGGTYKAPFLDVSPNGEQAMIENNFGTVTGMTRAVVPHMTNGGSIINVTSVEGHRACPGVAVYAAMKAAVTSLTMTLALELASRRIRVNTIAPDMLPSPSAVGEGDAFVGVPNVQTQPWPEQGSAYDAAAAAVFLASDLSRFVTGTTVHVDGGTWVAGGWKALPGGEYRL